MGSGVCDGWWGQLGDSDLDLREYVCAVCFSCLCVYISPPEALQRGCAYLFVHYQPPMSPPLSGGASRGVCCISPYSFSFRTSATV